ncbi:hypothetical protein QYE76_042476 [Lolium multiflorum]|uniref:Uncharacterized protein n=1 Tax=Lolium multiflorum TaxID=4521 RepID=A0AAD8TGU0_LOLMU|nr:hypothetical protein QYE76_042476 [Lolium multiflorum]
MRSTNLIPQPINIHRRPSFSFTPILTSLARAATSAMPELAGKVAGASPKRVHHRGVLRVLNSGEPPHKNLAADDSGHREVHYEETAKHSKFDELSAKVQVLEAENESLKNFVKKSTSQENQARKELSEKHARDLAELNEKLEKSQGRVISVISKNKVLEAEAEAIDKLIFPSLGFEWSKESNLKRTEAYDEARISIDALFEACRGIAKTLSRRRPKPRSSTR